MGFQIIVHEHPPIVEVVYPATPTAADVARYISEIRKVMEAASRKGDWLCLVDQRNLKLMDPKLVEHIASMNAFARNHGMKRSARVVAGALAALQAGRMARNASVGNALRTFDNRDEALAWLSSP